MRRLRRTTVRSVTECGSVALVLLAACAGNGCSGSTSSSGLGDDAATDGAAASDVSGETTETSEAAVEAAIDAPDAAEAATDAVLDAGDDATDAFGGPDSAGDAATDAFGGPDSAGDDATGDSASEVATESGPACTIGAACPLTAGGAGLNDPTCTCVACPSADATGDTACAAAYGSGYLCLSSGSGGPLTCTPADCRSTSGAAPTCSGGQICVGVSCGACATTSDCTATGAYGSGYVCNSGACVKGNCTTSSDCTGANAKTICVSNSCTKCTSDAECANDPTYGAGNSICDVASGTCNSSVCGIALTVSACGPSSDHTCCTGDCIEGSSFSGTGAGKSCCSSTDCGIGSTTPNCVGNVCSTCTTVTDHVFYVDPIGGNDDGGSGADATNCTFKTLTHALSVVEGSGGTLASTTIVLLGDISTASGEAFPIIVPANIAVVGGTSPTALTMRTVSVPSGANAFLLAGSDASLSSLTITGDAGSAATGRYRTGVVVSDPTDSVVASIDHVTIEHAGGDGITIGGTAGGTTYGGTLEIGNGVVVTDSGTAALRTEGLLVAGRGVATITGGSATADQTHFDANTDHGIVVAQLGSITLTGTPGSAPYASATVTTSSNYVAGIAMSTSITQAAPLSEISGLVAIGTTNGNGIRIEGGSFVHITRSASLGNAGSGIYVTSSGQSGTAAQENAIGGIDLGTGIGDYGLNVLQLPEPAFGTTPSAAQSPNGGAGICLDVDGGNDGGLALHAEGNVFVTTGDVAIDCSQAASAGTAVSANAACHSVKATAKKAGLAASIGVVVPKGTTSAAAIDDGVCK